MYMYIYIYIYAYVYIYIYIRICISKSKRFLKLLKRKPKIYIMGCIRCKNHVSPLICGM